MSGPDGDPRSPTDPVVYDSRVRPRSHADAEVPSQVAWRASIGPDARGFVGTKAPARVTGRRRSRGDYGFGPTTPPSGTISLDVSRVSAANYLDRIGLCCRSRPSWKRASA